MTQAIAYLSFDGNCADAFKFYERALGGKLEVLMKGSESPMKDQMPDCGEGGAFADRILHARLSLPGGGMLYGGDCPPQMGYEGVKGVSMTVDYDTTDRAATVFHALSDGGQVTMPMQPTFWARQWGMCVDKFGVSWIVNGEPIPF